MSTLSQNAVLGMNSIFFYEPIRRNLKGLDLVIWTAKQNSPHPQSICYSRPTNMCHTYLEQQYTVVWQHSNCGT